METTVPRSCQGSWLVLNGMGLSLESHSGTRWFDSLPCNTLEDLFNWPMLEDLFQCVPVPLAVHLSDEQPTTLMEACRLADTWETVNQSHSTSQHRIVPPGYLSGSTHPKNGLPSKPTCTNCENFGHAEADCRYKLGNNSGNNHRQSTNNHQNSSSTSAQPPPQTVTAGRSACSRGPCRDCGVPGHSSSGYYACSKHVPYPRHVNLTSATSSMAVLPERSHPERVWTQSVSVALLDGSSLPVSLPATVDTGSDISLMDRTQVPTSATVDEKTRWTMTWVEDHSKTIPTVELRVTAPWGTQSHRLAW
ncbi:uncharacterized protein [Macrobrachium rosenbergii]|uniref:uncharacterized protein n=1 Tax=Macrobrachium rosenbergii TaxID=79674 RepID=UPI0034D6C652